MKILAEQTNNPLQLLVSLTADEKTSLSNFQSAIDTIKTQIKTNFEIEGITISDTAIANLKKQVTGALDGIEFNPDIGSGTGKGFSELERQLDEAKKQIEELKRMGQQFGNDPLGNRGKPRGGSGGKNPFEPLKVEAVKSIDAIEDEFKKMDISFRIVEKFRGEQKELEKIVYEIQREFGKLERIEFASAIDGDGRRGLAEIKSQVTSNDFYDLEKNLIKLDTRMNELYRSAKLSGEELRKFQQASYGAKTNSDIEEINRNITRTVNLKANENAQSKATLELTKQITKLESDLIMLAKRYPRHANMDALVKEQREIEKIYNTMRKMSSIQMGDGLTGLSPKNAKDLQTQLAGVQNRFAGIRAEASHASRDSLGIVDAFKIAMERFPIWMAASTAFYGTVRTAREFMSIIVDIDTKMTDLAKVMSEDTDFEGLFDRATVSAEKFGQSISQVLDSYTEFARQGFKGDELGMLADAGLVASNVGDITAQKASEYMTASLIQWKKDANEAMGIIDSWNEISNSYATTTEKLAQGQSRAGATARAMGLEFDQVNAIIGTV